MTTIEHFFMTVGKFVGNIRMTAMFEPISVYKLQMNAILNLSPSQPKISHFKWLYDFYSLFIGMLVYISEIEYGTTLVTKAEALQ